jgi:peptide/nickel transport system substrate-binding protein
MRSPRRSVETVAMAIALVAAACGDSVEDATTTTAATPPATTTTTTEPPAGSRHGGEVVVGLDMEPPTLNPFVPGGDVFAVRLVGNAFWAGASRIDGSTLERIPDVLAELPSVANGGLVVGDDGTMTVRYRIVEEAVWADGVPITGDDFAFTYETIMNPDLPIISRLVYEDIVPDSIRVGPKTFEFALAAPTVAHESLFGVILPRHDVEGSDFANDYDNAPWVSGGPFVFDEWQPGSFIRVIRNDRYWRRDGATGDPLPYLDSVELRFTPETFSMIGAFIDGEIDLILVPPAPSTIAALHGTEGVAVDVRKGPIWEHISFSFSENSLERNPNSYNAFLEYRRAVAHAIDAQAIVDDLYGGAVRAMTSYLDAYLPAWSSGAWDRYDHDPARSRALLDDLCARDDTDCDARPPTAMFTTTSGGEIRERVADMLVPMLEEAGIRVVLELEPSTIFFGETLDTGRWDLGMWAWVGFPELAGTVGAHGLWTPSHYPPQAMNYQRWGSPVVRGSEDPVYDQGPSLVIDDATRRAEELWEALSATVDEVELRALVAEFEELLADNVVFIPVWQRPDPAAWWRDRLGGFIHNPSQSGFTWNMGEWYRMSST